VILVIILVLSVLLIQEIVYPAQVQQEMTILTAIVRTHIMMTTFLSV
jgi:phosphoglycerol transferase MdoB-like AlkP superfamily enzyme